MSSAAVTLLRAHLDQLRAGGRTTVQLSPEAMNALAKLSGQKPPPRLAAPAGRAGSAEFDRTRPAAATDATEAPLASLRQVLKRDVVSPPMQRAPQTPVSTPPERELQRTPAPPASPQTKPAPAGGWAVIEVPGATVEEKLNQLAHMAEADPAPRALGTLRQTMVFAVGSPEARLMFVGEAPGEHEEQLREPFVGPAGQLLTKIIENAMGLQRA